MIQSREEILKKHGLDRYLGILTPHFYAAMDEYAKQNGIAFFNWVVDTYLNDEARLPLSYSRTMGGRTIFIDHEEKTIDQLFTLFVNDVNNPQQ